MNSKGLPEAVQRENERKFTASEKRFALPSQIDWSELMCKDALIATDTPFGVIRASVEKRDMDGVFVVTKVTPITVEMEAEGVPFINSKSTVVAHCKIFLPWKVVLGIAAISVIVGGSNEQL